MMAGEQEERCKEISETLGKEHADCKSREGANSPEKWDHY